FYLLQLSRVEVVILFAVALNDPQAKLWSFLAALRRAGQRRDYSSKYPGTVVCGPVLTAFGRSFHCEKHHHLRPKRRPFKRILSQ
ncbi:MAG: hypothetical protein IIU24_09845, partial [Selenomonas sp.]|nr:hypothetical protein [Selenomonas sp.]